MSEKTTKRFEVCKEEELTPGERIIVELDGKSIGIFNVDGEYHAILNVCPHMIAPLAEGDVTGTTVARDVGEVEWTREGEIIRCPWHGWEFELATGESTFNPHLSTQTYNTEVEPSAKSEADDDSDQEEIYGVELAGDEPPVETYDVEVEEQMVVVYV